MNIALGNSERTITYNQNDPLTMPDGTIINNGDLKPVWQNYEEVLNIKFDDVTVQDQKATEMLEVAAATQFKDAVIYGGGGITYLLDQYGTEGYFVNLADYSNQLPNFNKFLDDNPGVEESITSFDGGMYYMPYVAEIGNYARTFHLREDWVTALLDSTDMLETETATLNVAYEAYWDEDETATEMQDSAASGGTLDATTARETLVKYINDNYDYDNPSELFLGSDAMYDIDELVALFRVVKLHPNTLTKVSTGAVVEGAYISPFFTRQSKVGYRDDALRLINYFGGEQVYGSDSATSKFYFNEDDELVFSYAEDGFLEGVERLNQMYSEGLIYDEFADLNNKTNFRTELYGKDDVEGHKEFGFMTNDWIASTTAINEDVVGVLPPVTTIPSSDGEKVHYLENTRAIKPDGWSISTQSSEDEINAALILFDHLYSEEGSMAHVYGSHGMVVEGEEFTGPDGIDYPMFDDWVVETAEQYTSGDVSKLLRDYVGGLIPIGYPKEIGFEYQYTTDSGFDAWALHQENEVIMPSYGNDELSLRLTPPAFSLTPQQTGQIATLNIGESQVDSIFLYITNASNAPKSIDELKQLYIDAGIEMYSDIHNEAYESTK